MGDLMSVGGLASGLDSKALVEALMAIERKPQNRLKVQQAQAEARKAALSDVASKLSALKSAATALRSATLWADTQTVESSNASTLTARRMSGAGPGGYSIAVERLASAEQRTYTYTPSASPGTIAIGAATIGVAAGATLQNVADAINANGTAPVYAAAVNGSLVLSARTTGTTSAFSASGATIAEDPSKRRAGADARYSIDGATTQTSPSNTLASAIPAVEVTLKAAGTATVNVGAPGVDPAAVTDKLKAFVDAYNGAVDTIRAKLAEKRVPNATTDADAKKGVLFGDALLTGVLGRLRSALSDVVAGNPAARDELSEIGVATPATTGGGTLSQDALAGELVFTADKLTVAMAADPAGVRRLLGGTLGIDGFSQRMETLLGSAGIGGLLDGRVGETDKQVARVKTAIADWDTRLARRESRLKAQYAALETALSSSQSRQQWLTAQINGLS